MKSTAPRARQTSSCSRHQNSSPTSRDSDSASEICRADSCPSRKQKTASKDFRPWTPPALAVPHVSTCLAHRDKKKRWRFLKPAAGFVGPGPVYPRAPDSESLVVHRMSFGWPNTALSGLPLSPSDPWSLCVIKGQHRTHGLFTWPISLLVTSAALMTMYKIRILCRCYLTDRG